MVTADLGELRAALSDASARPPTAGRWTARPAASRFDPAKPHPARVAPDCATGIALGVGGLAGGYAGARLQSRLPDVLIRRLVSVLVIAIGARCLVPGPS